jgi:L-ascorbate metabolism protein UlaG (beta-lactamase superfamily)
LRPATTNRAEEIGEDGYPTDQRLLATFLGTSSLLFQDGDETVLIDGFFTRDAGGARGPSEMFWLLLPFGSKVEPSIPRIESVLERLQVERVSALPVVHSHHDHGMDSGTICKLTGCTLIGSESTANLGRGAGLLEQQIAVVDKEGVPIPQWVGGVRQQGVTTSAEALHAAGIATDPDSAPRSLSALTIDADKQTSPPPSSPATPDRALRFGAFEVSMIESKHIHLPVIGRFILNKSIPAPIRTPTPLLAYKEGASYSVLVQHDGGTATLVQGSANYIPHALDHVKVDVVFLGIGGLEQASELYLQEYWQHVVLATGAHTVVPVHWDDFSIPLDEPPIAMPGTAKMIEWLEGVCAASGIKLQWLLPWDVTEISPVR